MHRARFDSTLPFLKAGYRFISAECDRLGVDVFSTRIALFRPLICMRGEEAARLFYDERRFQRQSAAPLRLQKTLTGQSGVQGLDGDAHRARKALFMDLMSPPRLRELTRLMATEWETAVRRWQGMTRIVLYEESQEVLCRAVCRWAGVPLRDGDARRRTDQFVALIEGAGAVGPRHWQGRAARRELETWIAGLVHQVRSVQLEADKQTALRVIAECADERKHLLDPRIAAVEIINVIRPTIAISTFIAFAALALHEYPEARGRVHEGDAADAERFVQEVRRFYPFFPFIVARVKKTFEWHGMRFPRGRRVLLDLYGTDHHPRIWQDPETFNPERFRRWDGSAFNFIPHGGGEHRVHHRCAGEWITIELMKVAVLFLVRGMTFEVPPQDMSYSRRRVPTRPRDGFIMTNVRLTASAEAIVRTLDESPRLRVGHGHLPRADSVPAEVTEIG